MTKLESILLQNTKYKNGVKTGAKESDHRTLILKIDHMWNPNVTSKEERIEVFNYKNVDNLKKFIHLTSNSEDLKHCFHDNNVNLEESSKKWLRILKGIIKSSFTKIRVKKNKLLPELEKLFQEKESLKSRIAEKENLEAVDEAAELCDELNEVEEKIANICAKKNKALVDEHLGAKNDTIEGYSQAKIWSLKKKLSPKNTIDPPAAKKDEHGNLVTDREALEDLYLETYKSRLKPNPVADGYEDLKELNEYLSEMQLKLAKSKISRDWSIDDFEKALKSFKNNKARDEHGHVYELKRLFL